MRKFTLLATASLLLAVTSPAQAQEGAVSLQEAISVAVQSNPQIIQAQMNKEAIEFERKQAQGLYLPRIDLEASAGVRRLENRTRRTLGIADDELYPLEASLSGEWTVLDFGRRRGELLRQAARVDGASLRVVERSEFVGLQVARQYLDVLLQQRVLAASEDNAAFHQTLVNDLGQHPLVREAMADVDAANAAATSAEGDLYPTVGLEVRGRVGDDIDGFQGETNDVLGRVVLRWNIWDGGINRAKLQETIRRASESRYRLHDLQRQAEEDVRTAWSTMQSQGNVVEALNRQSQVSDDLLLSYRSQFNVGRRSLLDVLDAQNTRYSTQVRLESARFSQLFAQYQALAASNDFLEAMSIAPGTGAGANERERFDYGPPVAAELQRRVTP